MIRLGVKRHYLWRNIHAAQPVMAGALYLDDAYGWTTAALPPALVSVLQDRLPGVVDGTRALDAAELIANVGQGIQRTADVAPPLCGVAARDPDGRRATVFFSCMDPYLGDGTLTVAAQTVDRLTRSELDAAALAKSLDSSFESARGYGLYVSTRRTLAAAERKGIPWVRTSAVSRHATLGQGCRQHRLIDTVLGVESALGQEFARNKLLTLTLLSQLGLPVGKFFRVANIQQALEAAETVGYPLVLKPTAGGKGVFVFVNLRNPEDLCAALAAAPIQERRFLLQSHFPGNDHRMLVVGGKLVAAALRIPASVTGDGTHSVAELVEIENFRRKPMLGPIQTIELDAETDRILAQHGYNRGSVPAAGLRVDIRGTANISTGGSGVDVTALVHPDNERVAVRAAKALELTVAGVDFICPDISKSWHDVGGGICEVNTSVGLRPHVLGNPGQDVAGAILETVYPRGDEGRIPTAMVTGTMGKTTTTLMLGSILERAGHTAGCATTEGVRIGGEDIVAGDYAGPGGAAIVLRDATVTAAVLETARGGIIRSGIYLDRCDVAALLNVHREQIEMDGIATLDDMTALKRKVLDAARHAVVLNADDPRCRALVPEFADRMRTILFSRDAESDAVRQHLARGGEAVFLGEGDGAETIVLASGGRTAALVKMAELPVTFGGMVWPHACNAMAAAALAMGLGIGTRSIVEGLTRYGKEFPAAKCRVNFAGGFPLRIVFDFTANPAGLAAVASVTDAMAVSGKRFCAITVPGNRPDWQYAECAAALAGHFDRYVCYEREYLRRGKKPGEIAARLAQALIAAGVEAGSISTAMSNAEAAHLIAPEAGAEDLVVVFAVNGNAQIEEYRAAFRERGRTSPTPAPRPVLTSPLARSRNATNDREA